MKMGGKTHCCISTDVLFYNDVKSLCVCVNGWVERVECNVTQVKKKKKGVIRYKR